MPEKVIFGGEPSPDAQLMGVMDSEEFLTALGNPRDVEQGFGVSDPYDRRADLLQESSDRKRQDALEILRRSLVASPEVSPSQALAAGILAVIPTIGGYMAGRSVGTPAMSPHLRLKPDELSKTMPGGASGGIAGAALGLNTSDKYLESLQAQQELENKANTFIANEQLKGADSDERQAETYRIRGMDKESQMDYLNAQIAARPGIEQKVAEKVAIEKGLIEAGLKGAPVDFSGKSPEWVSAYEELAGNPNLPIEKRKEYIGIVGPAAANQAMGNLRSLGYAQSVQQQQARAQREILMTQANNYVTISPVGLDPKLNAQRAELRANKAMYVDAMDRLVDSYATNGIAVSGPEYMSQASNASLAFSAARTLAGTGANLTGNEKTLVTALTAPNITIDDASRTIYNFITQVGDFAKAADSIRKVVSLSFDAKLAGMGQTSPEYAALKGLQAYNPQQMPGMENLPVQQQAAPAAGRPGIRDRIKQLRGE